MVLLDFVLWFYTIIILWFLIDKFSLGKFTNGKPFKTAIKILVVYSIIWVLFSIIYFDRLREWIM